jgi:hypothetical protein
MKQTAVEYLLEYCERENWSIPNNIIEQAKEIEREQIMDAHIEGQRVFDDYPHTQWTNDQAELYYNETFNNKKK